MHTTNVYITVNVEIGAHGLWEDPAPVDAHATRLEARLALELLARDDLAGTFFVEALHTLCLGDEPMGAIARRIRAAGHDVQMLLRPGWMGHDREEPPCGSVDLLAGRTRRFLHRVFDLAEDAFRRWEVPAPFAARSAHPHVDRVVYEAMAQRGLKVASHIGLAERRPAESSLRLHAGRHWIDGVLELPVLSYEVESSFGYTRLASLVLSEVPFAEMVEVLERAHACGADEIVLRMHVRDLHAHRERFKQLCAFLAANRRRFETRRFTDDAPIWFGLPGTGSDDVLAVSGGAVVA